MHYVVSELADGLPSMIVKLSSSRMSYHSGLHISHHQGWISFQDCAISGGKPRNVARSSQKFILWLKNIRTISKKKTQEHHRRISLDQIMNTWRQTNISSYEHKGRLKNQSIGKILEGGCSSYNTWQHTGRTRALCMGLVSF